MSNTRSSTKNGVKAEKAKPVEKEEAMSEEAVEEKAETAASAQPIVQFVTPKDPMVKILYLDSAIPNNEIPIGNGRAITGSGRIFNVALGEFEGTFMTAFIQKLIRRRKLIILDGLTDEQREMYDCLYKEGEIIKNEGMFDRLLNMPIDEMKRIFSEFCPEHRSLVAKRVITAFENGDNRISEARIKALNEVSKKDFEDGKGAFTSVIKTMNENI